MRNDINNKLISYAKANDAIESMFCIKDENYDSFYKVYTIVNDIIIGKLEEELVGLFDDVVLVNRIKEEFTIDKSKVPFTSINIYKKDNTKITESIISSDYADVFVKKLPKEIQFIYNKPGVDRLDINDNFRYESPKEYEFTSTIRNFFANAIEVSLYITEKDEIAASLKMEELRSYLLAMIDFYVKEKYAYTMDKGYDGQKLKSTLDIDTKENFLFTYHHEDLMDIYNSLFKACVLFRRLAMNMCNVLGYAYPKEIDVESLKILRSNYKKLESFLS
ncbi:aminoglycoside 6-adenylyltransferase [Anaerococcus sp. mt242]|uniref:aminoglycoside 6-adenylyltransferase n=1 Tax=Anaerococcus sp. mt242 TaxID=2661917 RepID=UPI0019344FB2|nr:aminoglycoside 6-adenylyltransferase [Anaerococcus sp. mt242]MBM0046661.1 aminoglycoside 6-adenylyltransferase [Anaerococcus sp. mt242]